MEENSRRITNNTLLLYVRLFFSMIISLYTSRIVLDILGIDDFGLFSAVGGVVVILGFFNSSMLTATQRFLNYEMGRGNQKKLPEIFSTSLAGHYLVALIILVLSETIGLWFVCERLVIPPDRFQAALWVYQFSVFTFIVNLLSSPYNAVIIAHEKMGSYAWLSMADITFKLIVAYVLTCIDWDKLKLYGVLLFLSALIVRAIYVFYCKRAFAECSHKQLLNKDLLKKMFGFSGWMVLGTFSNAFSSHGVSIAINLFFTPVHNAARAIAQQVCVTMSNFASNFMMAVHPPIVKAYSRGDEVYMYKLVFFSSKISFYLLYVLSLPLILQTEYLLDLWLKTVPAHTVLFTQLALVEMLITSSYAPIAAISQASGKIKRYQFIISIGFMAMFLLTLLLYSLGFPAVVTYLIAIGIALAGLMARLLELRKTVRFPVRKYLAEVTFRIAITAILSSIIPIIYVRLAGSPSLLHLVVVALMSVVFVSLFFWLFGLNPFEKQLLLKEIKQKCIRK
ncbi:MAG: lipopolysaccharide biosynthesis protein [Dysgonamonadaceae bacterium]|jgi:O-antigen/teichoic acid export membrane protein|nr:lipopolysaccharide biosynthesis protein [Dysgonamonadaceae bacterium]